MSRYVDISHFRAPYKNAVLQGFGAVPTSVGVPVGTFQFGSLRTARWQSALPLSYEQQTFVYDIWLHEKPTKQWGAYPYDHAPFMVFLRSRVAMGFRVFVAASPGRVRIVAMRPERVAALYMYSIPSSKWIDVTDTLKQATPPPSPGGGGAPGWSGFGAPEAVKLWYYDENPAGKVRCLVPGAVQVLLGTIAGNNDALKDVSLYAMPITVLGGVDITKAIPVVEVVKIVAVAKSGPQPTADQAIPLYQWVNGRSKMLQAVLSVDGTPLDFSTDALRAGKLGLVAGSNPQQIAGESMVIPSAIYANYTPVLPKPAPAGGGGGEEPSKAGIGPLGIATIAVVVVGLGYLALKKK